MASPQSGRFGMSPGSGRLVLSSPLSDEAIWKRLRESGFDEESIKRRDKAGLIAYISKLEAEIFDHQHHMGLLILEKKEWSSKHQEIKDSAEAAELKYRCELSSQASALAEARKREEVLKKALRVEKECIANLEKALHEMRAECAETKVAAESRLAEARAFEDDALKKSTEAEAKLLQAEALDADAKRYHRTAERKLQEVEEREDDLRRRIMNFQSECDAKEKQLTLEKQVLNERQKTVQQEQEQLLDGKALLNQREDYIFNKSQELHNMEKEIEISKLNIEKELRALNEEKSVVELTKVALSSKEEDVLKKEAMLDKREKDLLIFQEKLANKEHEDLEKLKADHETALKKRMIEFDRELENKLKLAEDEIVTKRRAWELTELELNQRQDVVAEREHELESQLRILVEKEADVLDKLNTIEEKEKRVISMENEMQLKENALKKEEQDIIKMKDELKKCFNSLEERKKQVDMAEEHLETMKSESSELLALEFKLKEEIDVVRSEKLQLTAREEELKLEKAKFEAEWEALDEKRLELQKEAEHLREERTSITKFLKEERDMLKSEKNLMQEEHKRNVDLLSREREAFMSKMVNDRAELFNKIQQERDNFLQDIEMQKKELENCIEKKREELESQFRENKNAFELEKKRELDTISSLKDSVAKDLEHVAAEMKRLEAERLEIKLDRERRDKEWTELINSIEELKVQRQKLQEQRESLHADREEIFSQINSLKKLEQLKIAAEKIAAAEKERFNMQFQQESILGNGFLEQQTPLQNGSTGSQKKQNDTQSMQSIGSPGTAPPLSWIKRCATLIFKPPTQHSISQPLNGELSTKSPTDSRLTLSANLSDRFDNQVVRNQECQHQEYLSTDTLGISRRETAEALHLDEVANDLQKGVKEDSFKAHSEKIIAGSKRKNDESSFQDVRDGLEEGQLKKRRQEVSAEESTPEIFKQCVISTESSVLELSGDQNEGAYEEDDVVVIDKIIKVTEMSCVDTDHENIDCLQNSLLELDQGLFGDGESNGSEPGKAGNIQRKEPIEEAAISGSANKAIEESQNEDIVYHGEDKKVGPRTRSRQKA